MATQVQFRRGTTTQNNAFTGAIGEITYDTEAKTLRLHDGSSAGGGAIVCILAGTQTLTNKTLSTGSTWQGNAVGLAYGGTNANITPAAGGVIYSTSSALAVNSAGTSGQVLTSAGSSAPTWTSQSSLSVGTATTATRASNIDGGSAGYLVYQVDTNDTGFIAPGATGYILRSTGASTAPEWVTSALTIGTTPLQVGDTAASFDGLNILTATGTSHWKIPVGTTAQRPGTPAAGMIRYNSSQSTFEGYSSGAWSSLGGVKSVDAFTYIQAETSAGASNGDLDFFAENSAGDGATQVGQWNRTNLKDYTGTLVGTQTTQNVFNATATTVNAFGAATSLTIGATSGTATIRNTTVAITNSATVGGTLGVTGATTLTGALAANGGITVDTNAFTVADTTGNTAIAGTLDVNGVVNLNNTTDCTALGTAAVVLDGGLSVAKKLHVGTNLEVDGNMVIDGNFTVNGTTTTINATNLAIEDNLIYLNEGSTVTNPDLGWVGNYNDGTYRHTGMFRDASDSGKFKLFKNYTPEPDSAIDTSHATYDHADLQLGGLTVDDNATIAGTLSVTGNTTLSGTLELGNASDTTLARSAAGVVTIEGVEIVTLSRTQTLTNKTLTSPTLTTPSLGVATATSINKVAFTAPATGSTLTIADGKTLTANNTLTFTGTDSSSVAFGGGGTVAYTANKLSVFASTSSSELASVISDETGTGSLVFSADPTFTGTLTAATISATTITETSDERLKTDIVPLTNALEIVNSLNGKAFVKDGKASIGLIAQQVKEVLPQVVVTADDEMKTMSVQYGNIVAVLIEAVKEQQKQIEELKAKLGN